MTFILGVYTIDFGVLQARFVMTVFSGLNDRITTNGIQ